MIEVRNLTKKYGSHVAVQNLSFTMEEGKIYGFLGPNGAGKSTTMNIITGCLAATDGTVLIDGYDIFKFPNQAKRHIGYLPEQPPLYMDMTPYEYLRFVGNAKGLRGIQLDKQIREVIEQTHLEGMERRLIKNLSKGYKQRVGIAQAILGDPKIVILDEPTVGLDPKQITEIRELIRSLGKGRTVVLSSHILQEISAVCDHVMIISKGRLVANDSLQALEEKYTGSHNLVVLTRASEQAALSVVSGIAGIESASCAPSAEAGVSQLTLTYPGDKDFREEVYHAFRQSPYPILSMVHSQTTLEDIFLELTAAGDEEEEKDVFPSTLFSSDTAAPSDKPDDGDIDDDVDNEKPNAEEDGDDEDDYKPLFS